jgi:hypothetical protein
MPIKMPSKRTTHLTDATYCRSSTDTFHCCLVKSLPHLNHQTTAVIAVKVTISSDKSISQ